MSAPVLSLHHVGYLTADIEPVAAEYIRRFGYVLSSPVVHDPQQTALVQFLKLPGDRAYLEFVAPDGPESKLARGVEKLGRRSPLHHLCYATISLEASIEHLRAEDLLLIAAPHPAVALGGRRICWLVGRDSLLIELVELFDDNDLCTPNQGPASSDGVRD